MERKISDVIAFIVMLSVAILSLCGGLVYLDGFVYGIGFVACSYMAARHAYDFYKAFEKEDVQ